jgi:hypothetical protein
MILFISIVPRVLMKLDPGLRFALPNTEEDTGAYGPNILIAAYAFRSKCGFRVNNTTLR